MALCETEVTHIGRERVLYIYGPFNRETSYARFRQYYGDLCSKGIMYPITDEYICPATDQCQHSFYEIKVKQTVM